MMEISAKKLAEQRRSCTQQFHLTFGSHLRGPQPLMSPTQTHHEQEDFGDTPNLYDVPKYEYIFIPQHIPTSRTEAISSY